MAAIANRYARALADVSFKLGQHEVVERELEQFGQMLDGNRELSAFYADPAINAVRKKAATSNLLARLGFCKTTGNFIHVLVERDRMGRFNEMLEAFRRGVRDRLGIGPTRISWVGSSRVWATPSTTVRFGSSCSR